MSENVSQRQTIGKSIRDLLSNPVEYLIWRWNWKSAVTSALIHGAIFFTANLSSGVRAATGALLVEFVFRAAISGFYGSLTELLRKCEPAWAATLFVMLAMPLSSHAIEFLVHSLRGTPQLKRSMVVSVGFTIVSTLFNYYAMRRGVLVVGEGRRPFSEDLQAMPRLIASFLTAGPRALWKLALARS